MEASFSWKRWIFVGVVLLLLPASQNKLTSLGLIRTTDETASISLHLTPTQLHDAHQFGHQECPFGLSSFTPPLFLSTPGLNKVVGQHFHKTPIFIVKCMSKLVIDQHIRENVNPEVKNSGVCAEGVGTTTPLDLSSPESGYRGDISEATRQ